MAGIFSDIWRSVMGGPEDGGAGGAEGGGGGCAFNTPVARSVPLEPEEATARVEELVPQLVERRYKLLALDFDQTIISEHTGGMWAGTAEELARFVRPVMAALLRAASAAEELQLAVVTFSGQIAIVRAVLASVVGEGAASRIAIRGADGSWPVPAGAPQGGKMPHLHSVWADIMKRTGEEVGGGQTVLVDDDRHNIEVGEQHGVAAIWFNPAEGAGGDRTLLRQLAILD